MTDFVHLHTHSQYSLLDGANKLDELCARVRALGMSSLAVTDHGNLFGAVEFYDQALKHGLKPIIGCEAYIAPGRRDDKTTSVAQESGTGYNYHLTLLAENATGYQNLLKLVSEAYLSGFYYKPRMDKDLLRQHHEGITALSGCLKGEVAGNLSHGTFDRAKQAALEYRDIFGKDHFFIEVMDHGMPQQKEIIPGLVKLAGETGIPMVATNDCHYLQQDDAFAHEVLLCIGTGRSLDDDRRMKFYNNEFYVKSGEEMAARFASISTDCLSNTVAIAERVAIRLEDREPQIPRYVVPVEFTPESYLREVARAGLDQRLEQLAPLFASGRAKLPPEAYRERLEIELDVISKVNFPSYFLIVWDFIKFARENGIPVGPGRGSAAGSLVAYSLRITDIDPLQYNLLFERFLNPDRLSLPDIDIDFCMRRRDRVIRYVTEKYGRDNVAQIITFGTLKAKAALRDVGRVIGMPYSAVDRIAKMVPDGLGVDLARALRESPQLAEAAAGDEKVGQMVELAKKLEGLVRNAGMHAAGVVIAPKPIIEYVPLYRTTNDEITTQFDKDIVERMGLIKMDFLGLITLTVIDDALISLRLQEGIELDLDALPLDDLQVFDLFCAGATNGVFQFESNGMKDLLRKVKPRTFEDLVALNALYRPGSMGFIDEFTRRKHGKIKTKYIFPELEPILGETYGIIVYQEQVMQIAAQIGGYSLGQADLLRKAMGKKKKEIMVQERENFVRGAVAHGHPKRKSEELWDQIEPFAGYGFNKSHSVAYANLAYKTAYLKVHHARHFMAAMLTAQASSTDEVVKYIGECQTMGIAVLPPNVDESLHNFSVVGDTIRFGLGAVKGIGEGAVDRILESRIAAGPFQSLRDFAERVDLRAINRKVFECLIKSGSFDSFAPNRRTLFESLESTLEQVLKEKEEKETGQGSLFGSMIDAADLAEEPTRLPEWPADEKLRYEKETLGFYITGHPLAKHSQDLERFTSSSIADLKDRLDQAVRIGGVVLALKKTKIKKGMNEGKMMARLQLEDLSGSIGVNVFSELYAKQGRLLESDKPILISGTAIDNNGTLEFRASEIAPLEGAREREVKEIVLRLITTGIADDTLGILRELLLSNHGDIPVTLRLVKPASFTVALKPHYNFRVAPSPALSLRLQEMLGDEAVEYRF